MNFDMKNKGYIDQILKIFEGRNIHKSKFKVEKDGTTTSYLFLDYNILMVISIFKHKETGLDSVIYQLYNSKSYRCVWMSSCHSIEKFKQIIDENYENIEKTGIIEIKTRSIFTIIADFFLRFLRSFNFRSELKFNRWFFENILSPYPENE